MTPLSTLLARQKKLNIKATLAERQLMGRLRSAGLTVNPQVIIGPFIVDILIPKKMLVVEVDGGVHESKAAQVYDKQRTSYLTQHGFEVIRVPNSEVKSRAVVDLVLSCPDVSSRKACFKIIGELTVPRNQPGPVVAVGGDVEGMPW